MPPSDQLTNLSNLIQMGVVVVVAVWAIANIRNTANVLRATVDRMEKQMIRLQNEHSRMDRRVARLEGAGRSFKPDSPNGDAEMDE
jgi:hypothetical protein